VLRAAACEEFRDRDCAKGDSTRAAQCEHHEVEAVVPVECEHHHRAGDKERDEVGEVIGIHSGTGPRAEPTKGQECDDAWERTIGREERGAREAFGEE